MSEFWCGVIVGWSVAMGIATFVAIAAIDWATRHIRQLRAGLRADR